MMAGKVLFVIALRPFEKRNGNPHREQLMGSLYQWLYHSASRVFDVFGFGQARNVYAWRKECYTEARQNGEDVDKKVKWRLPAHPK